MHHQNLIKSKMKLNLILLGFTLFSVVLVGISHAMTPKVYWKSVLPNSPMPKSIKDLLNTTEWNDEKSTRARVGRDGVAVNSGRRGRGTNTAVGRGGVGVHSERRGRRTNVGIGRGGVGVHSDRRGRRPVSVGLRPGRNPFQYHYAASEDQLKDNPNVAMFFLENDLHKGQEMNVDFTENEQNVTFLPRKVADSMPFSSNNLLQIYKKFSLDPNSSEAEAMKQTLKECEDKGIEGEEKYCATSIESMIDFCTTKLGKKVKAISTEMIHPTESTLLQKYKIEAVKKLASSKAVVCHKEKYMYAVFYCHKTISTRVYAVSMAGADGAKVKAVAVCHTDTGKWNPKHLAFQVLKVKPRSVPVCHFLPQDHVVWVPY